MEDENRDQMRAAVIEAMIDAVAEWLPRDATIADVFYIVSAAALGILVRACESPEQGVELCRVLGDSLSKVSVEDARRIRALPESGDR